MKKILLTYISVFFGYTTFFFVLLHSFLFEQLNILFYRGIILLIGSFVIVLFVGIIIKKKRKLHFESFFAALMISMAFHIGFFIVFPVTYDRSVTTYMLYKLNTKTDISCEGIYKKDLEKAFISEYVQKQKALERRIYEQLVINSITKQNECLTLTTKGKLIIKMADIVKWIYHIR